MKNEDIADTFVIIRDVKDYKKLIYQNTLPYFRRALEIHLKNEVNIDINDSKNKYEICLIAKDSRNSNRGFYKEQCKEIKNKSNAASKIYFDNVICILLIAAYFNIYL